MAVEGQVVMSGTDKNQKRRVGRYPVLANSFSLAYGIWVLAMLVEEFLLRNFTYNEMDPIFELFMFLALINFVLPCLAFGVAIFAWRQKSMLLWPRCPQSS